MADLELAREAFGRRGDEAGEGGLVPVDEVLFRLLALHKFLSLGFEQEVFDRVFRCLRHHPADIVEPLAPGASGDLMEVARAQDSRLLPAEFAQFGKEHGADRDVDADAQRVGAADDF